MEIVLENTMVSTNSEKQSGEQIRLEDDRAEWQRPVLRRLAANEAEASPGMDSDGMDKRS
jgi:hypothetical protein